MNTVPSVSMVTQVVLSEKGVCMLALNFVSEATTNLMNECLSQGTGIR